MNKQQTSTAHPLPGHTKIVTEAKSRITQANTLVAIWDEHDYKSSTADRVLHGARILGLSGLTPDELDMVESHIHPLECDGAMPFTAAIATLAWLDLVLDRRIGA